MRFLSDLDIPTFLRRRDRLALLMRAPDWWAEFRIRVLSGEIFWR